MPLLLSRRCRCVLLRRVLALSGVVVAAGFLAPALAGFSAAGLVVRVVAAAVPGSFPIRPGLLAQISLPADLTKAEAKRLAAFVESLAMDEPEPPRALSAPPEAPEA